MGFGKTPKIETPAPVQQVSAVDISNAYANSMAASAAAAGANKNIKTGGQGVGSPAETQGKMILGL